MMARALRPGGEGKVGFDEMDETGRAEFIKEVR
jgi:hypothetical protein